MNKKIVCYITILCLCPFNFLCSEGIKIPLETISERNGDILYVGGSGPGNYTHIQDAIDNATEGDTIYIYHKTYFEDLSVNKSIRLMGENKNTTIIKCLNSVLLNGDGIRFENLTVMNDNDGTGLLISNHQWNRIKNCTIEGSGNSVILVNSANTTFRNCLIGRSGSHVALRMDSSNNNNILDSIIGRSYDGVLLRGGGNNFFFNCSIGINGEAGVIINSGNNNIFSRCSIYQSGWGGIVMYTTRNNLISNCSIYQNPYGIRLFQFHPSNITIKDSEIFNNTVCGVAIDESTDNSKIENCRVHDNPQGIVIGQWSDYNTIRNCSVYNNIQGIQLYLADYNKIIDCKATNNQETGLTLEISQENQITNCAFSNNKNGSLFTYYCRKNSISYCKFSNNQNIGLHLNSQSYTTQDNSITYSRFEGNNNWDIRVEGYCFRNQFNHNSFLGILKEVYDTCQNYWDDGQEGNYYHLYKGKDQNGDGIGDTPYHVGTYNFDHYPLIYSSMDDPKIIIQHPIPRRLYFNNRAILPIPLITIIIGSINITVNASSPFGIQRVEFYIDNVLKSTDMATPYYWNWAEKKIFKHTISVIAYNNVGNSTGTELQIWKF